MNPSSGAVPASVPHDQMVIETGIVNDGTTIRFMTAAERELYARHALPATLIVIVPPPCETADAQSHE